MANNDDERAYAPHCDPTILHAPGKCVYCDYFPEWQKYREVAQIAFTGESDERGVKRAAPDESGPDGYVSGVSPCPSTWFRDPATRDRWGGNVAYTQADIDAVYASRRAAEKQWLDDDQWHASERRARKPRSPWRWTRGRR